MMGQTMSRHRMPHLARIAPLCLVVVLGACGANADDELQQWM